MMTASEIADRHNRELRAGVGHNRKVAGVDSDKLRSFVDRLENLEQEKQSYIDDIKDVMKEASSAGFDRKQLRNLLRLRKQDASKREEEQQVLDTYLAAMGMV